MTTTLRDQLQATLSGTHTLERELGGGGMSKVFVAEETRLKRKVVVKVLSPELAQGISIERFEREIQTVAALQQANIVPVISAGDTNGLPYYTMPFVEGESLRARLARGPLAVTEVIGVLRDVSKALAYAHQRGVVHRDIKPDNVLLSGGTAVVTDFGIAKAISAARTGSGAATLTQVGTSIGTPAYMAPEQAAGDPGIDHRADIYSLGAMAYELLAGQPVFANRTPQRMLAAHMGETPKPITEFRGDLPQGLSELVMLCLAKDADSRPQGAADIARVLESITSGSGMQSAPAVMLGGPAMFRKALAIYAGAFVAVAILAKAAIVGIGLPDWVFPGSLVVMALGLPVILWTGYVQRVARRAMTMTPTYTPGGTPSMAHGTIATMALKAAPHVSWYRTARGGMYAFGAFIVMIAAFMAMRTLGIGPFGSLFAAGALKAQDKLLVADFRVSGADTALATVVGEAVRTDLSQSRVVSVVPPTAILAALQRMQRPAGTKVEGALAREIAQRENAKAIVSGDVTPLGAGFVVTLRLVTADSARDLASFRETASDPKELLGVLGELSRALRGKIGESLRAVQSSARLESVTTSSLEALKKYAEGVVAGDGGEYERAIALYREAIKLDSTFAMAWRKLAVVLTNAGLPRDQQIAALETAMRYRDRMTERERYNLEGFWYDQGPARDRAKAAAAYEAIARMGIVDASTHNLANLYGSRREWARAESLYRKRAAAGGAPAVTYFGLSTVLWNQGKAAAAESVAVEMAKVFVGRPIIDGWELPYFYARSRLDSMTASIARLRESRDLPTRAWATFQEANLARLHGRPADAARWEAQARVVDRQRGVAVRDFADSLSAAAHDIEVRGAMERGVRRLDAVLARTPLASQPANEAPWFAFAGLYARAGRADRAKAIVAQYEATVRDTAIRRTRAEGWHFARAAIAAAEGRGLDAVREVALADSLPDGPRNGCTICSHLNFARAWDAANQPDSARAHYEAFVTTPWGDRFGIDATWLPVALNRLGELYEARGDGAKAIGYYRRFADLWKNAEPDLQPRVEAVRGKIARLRDVERKP